MSAVVAVAVTAAVVAPLIWLARPPPRPAAHAGAVLPGGAVVAYSPGYRISFYGIERLHPFDIRKYDRIASGLVDRGLLAESDFAVAEPVGEEALRAVHDGNYLASLHSADALGRALEVNVPGLVSASALERRVLDPFQAAVGGTVLAARGAVEHGFGVNLGGGYHHARPQMGHGFCIYNDVALAIHTLREEGLTGPILIVDTDAHQGDGSHAFFAEDPTVFSFSMHQGDIFPIPKLGGNLDVPLRAGTDDDAFLWALEQRLPDLLDQLEPVLVVHVAGADVLVDDPLANFALSPRGLVNRDVFVARTVRERGIPLLHLLAGGYGPSAAMSQEASVAAMLELLRDGIELLPQQPAAAVEDQGDRTDPPDEPPAEPPAASP
jgi:histone deacetylase 11